MTNEELRDLLKEELKQGEVTVTATSSQTRIDWNVNGSNIVTVFDPDILKEDRESIKEEFIKPTALKFKMLRRRNEMEVK